MKKRTLRILSLVLTVCTLIGFLPAVSTPVEAYNMNNAPAASMEQLASMELTFTLNESGGGLRLIDGKLWVWGSNSGWGKLKSGAGWISLDYAAKI